MECVKMYYVIVFTLLTWAVTSSEGAFSTKFKGSEPEIVLLGSNVTLSWTYVYTAGQDDELFIIYFNFVDGQKVRTNMVKYVYSSGESRTFTKFGGYFDSVVWVGNKTRKVAAFRMNNVSNLAHDHTFDVQFYFGPGHSVYDEIKIFISVLPKVNLIVTKTNVTVGEIVTIQCKLVIQGRPQPTISWYQNGKILEQTGIYLINNEEIQQKHAGSYECKATNDAGSSRSKVVMITVHKKPGDQDNGKPEKGARNSSGLGAGAIVGIVLAILVIIVIVIVVAFVMIRKGKPAKPVRSSNVNGDDTQEAMVSDATKKDQVWL